MRYRRLGKTGLSVSVIGVDTCSLAGSGASASLSTMSTSCWDGLGKLGVSLIDTAECCGDYLTEAHAVAGVPHRASDPGGCGGFDAKADRI
jgi:aryl-alcohol dehydrogenase-like predicted oxidoreductase